MTEKDKNPTAALVTRLSQAVGVSSYTGPHAVQDAVAAELTPHADRVDRDRMGSVVGVKLGRQTEADPAARRKIMLAAHLDEIGAVVTALDDDVLRVTKIGGLDARVLMGQDVMVHGRQDLPGVIGSIPPHLLPPGQSRQTVDLTKMHIDVGLPATELAQQVRVGDLVSFVRPPQELLNGQLSGKAMDNRASVAAMILCLQNLAGMDHQWDVYAVATAEEEWGQFVGATTQTYAIRPDAAVVLDVTFADVDEIDVKLDAGPVITFGPSNHPVLRKRLLDICTDLELKYQSEPLPSGAGTDAYAVEISREGVPTILISVPSRYMHSPAEVIHTKDLERIGRLLAHFIAGLDENSVDQLVPSP